MTMKKIRRALIFSAFASVVFLFVAFEETMARGVQKGIELALNIIIPSAFPFLIFSGFAVGCGAFSFLDRILGRIFKILFRLPEEAVSIVFFSFIGGYPAGAALSAKAYSDGRITKGQLNQIMTFAVAGAPAFIIGGVGRQMLNSTEIGIILYASNILSALITGFIFSRFHEFDDSISAKIKKSGNAIGVFTEATETACKSMMIICGYAVFFSALIELITYLNAAGEYSSFAFMWAEVTNGASVASDIFNVETVCAVLSFGGLAVHFQIITLLKGKLNLPLFFASRIVSVFLSVILCRFILMFYSPVMSVYSDIKSVTVSATGTTPVISVMIILLSFFMILSSGKEKRNIDFSCDI